MRKLTVKRWPTRNWELRVQFDWSFRYLRLCIFWDIGYYRVHIHWDPIDKNGRMK